MPRTAISAQAMPGALDYDGAAITWAAMDDVNLNNFVFTGREVLLVRNDDASPQDCTIKAVADNLGRTTDATKSVAAGAYHMFGPWVAEGWRQTDGKINVDPADANLMAALLRW